uniref:Uncharacterized protein n=1 Tax=Panagrolaimus davidi TaxID=227884 RepID=A0A914PGN6_9BILA
MKIIYKACRQPISTIIANADIEPSVMIENIMFNKEVNYGYDAMNDQFVNMIEAGIIDPTKVIRTALQDAAGVTHF